MTLIVLLPSIAAGIAVTGLDFGISEKLFEEEVTAQSFSRIDRLESISAAVNLFAEKPLFGQGLQTYGFLSNDRLSGPLLTTYDESYRCITNNIYAELAAELGLIGLMLLIVKDLQPQPTAVPATIA
jgi:O-antigen ligase